MPPASTSRISAAVRRGKGAVNDSVIGSSERQFALLLTRSQLNAARNAGRTWNASAWSAPFATPLAVAMPLPQTSFTSASAGSVRAQASVTSGEPGVSRSFLNFSSSLPVGGSAKAKARLLPVSASSSTTRR